MGKTSTAKHTVFRKHITFNRFKPTARSLDAVPGPAGERRIHRPGRFERLGGANHEWLE